ncbi:hypothetical protein BJ742DRAFT_860270 [Cladochytrium replicatum]|nr:hypothetical protein BJ742DRAFT_860270 [Cladochytrium replicatum]
MDEMRGSVERLLANGGEPLLRTGYRLNSGSSSNLAALVPARSGISSIISGGEPNCQKDLVPFTKAEEKRSSSALIPRSSGLCQNPPERKEEHECSSDEEVPGLQNYVHELESEITETRLLKRDLGRLKSKQDVLREWEKAFGASELTTSLPDVLNISVNQDQQPLLVRVERQISRRTVLDQYVRLLDYMRRLMEKLEVKRTVLDPMADWLGNNRIGPLFANMDQNESELIEEASERKSDSSTFDVPSSGFSIRPENLRFLEEQAASFLTDHRHLVQDISNAVHIIERNYDKSLHLFLFFDLVLTAIYKKQQLETRKRLHFDDSKISYTPEGWEYDGEAIEADLKRNLTGQISQNVTIAVDSAKTLSEQMARLIEWREKLYQVMLEKRSMILPIPFSTRSNPPSLRTPSRHLSFDLSSQPSMQQARSARRMERSIETIKNAAQEVSELRTTIQTLADDCVNRGNQVLNLIEQELFTVSTHSVFLRELLETEKSRLLREQLSSSTRDETNTMADQCLPATSPFTLGRRASRPLVSNQPAENVHIPTTITQTPSHPTPSSGLHPEFTQMSSAPAIIPQRRSYAESGSVIMSPPSTVLPANDTIPITPFGSAHSNAGTISQSGLDVRVWLEMDKLIQLMSFRAELLNMLGQIAETFPLKLLLNQ